MCPNYDEFDFSGLNDVELCLLIHRARSSLEDAEFVDAALLELDKRVKEKYAKTE